MSKNMQIGTSSISFNIKILVLDEPILRNNYSFILAPREASITLYV